MKAELEIELLHNKIDTLREREILKLIDIIQRLSAHLAPELAAIIQAEGSAGGRQLTHRSPMSLRSMAIVTGYPARLTLMDYCRWSFGSTIYLRDQSRALMRVSNGPRFAVEIPPKAAQQSGSQCGTMK